MDAQPRLGADGGRGRARHLRRRQWDQGNRFRGQDLDRRQRRIRGSQCGLRPDRDCRSHPQANEQAGLLPAGNCHRAYYQIRREAGPDHPRQPRAHVAGNWRLRGQRDSLEDRSCLSPSARRARALQDNQQEGRQPRLVGHHALGGIHGRPFRLRARLPRHDLRPNA